MEGVRRRIVRVKGGIHRGGGGEGGRGGGHARGRGRGGGRGGGGGRGSGSAEAGGKQAQRRRNPIYQINVKGGRGPIFTQEQDREIINMVLANNAFRLREIQANIIGDYAIFNTVRSEERRVG